MNPLVSVIIPVYNSQDYLNECLYSVANQSYNNIEIIIVNDGSTDESLKICEAFKSNHHNTKIVNKTNGGLSSARNAGLEVALGNYVTFVDSDDIIDKDMILTMVELAVKSNSQIVKIGLKRIYDDDPCVPDISTKAEILTPIQALNKIYDPQARIITICGKLFAKELFANFRLPEGLYYEDEYCTPRLFLTSNKIAVNFSNLYYYMQRDNNSIIRGELTSKKIHDSCFVVEDRINLFKKIGNKKLIIKSKIDFFYKLNKLLTQTEEFNLLNDSLFLQAKLKTFKKSDFLICVFLNVKQYLYNLLKRNKK